ncbi:MAG: hypothetical protein D6731_04785 [Planctomycetota bacterium]|nr:MAG: hypothetical protein D6731_04785 [Planctomycetota bacterium]
MPWQHCGRTMMDDEVCRTCGISKPKWTLKLDRTRLFALGKRHEGDELLQAEALREAAKNGAPFCEKCEEYERARQAEQAKALEQASRDGTPFCEDCEEAQRRRERAQAESQTSAAT